MKRALIMAVACSLATLLLSCRRRQQVYVYPTSQPSQAAVAGKYAVFGDSEVIKQYGAKGTLDVCPDGTFVMRNMLNWDREDELRRGKTWSGHGRWSVFNKRRAFPVHTGYRRPFVLRLDFDEIEGKSVSLIFWTPYFVGKAEPYDIYIPSLGLGRRVLILRKTGEPVLPTSGHLKREAQADN